VTDTSVQPVTPVPPPPASRQLPRWAKITLIASLAVNLLLIGSIVGHRLAIRQGPFASVFRAADDFTVFARKLPSERRQALRAIFDKHREEFRPNFLAIQEARKGLAAALSAEPFDKEKFIAALTTLQEAEAKARAARRAMTAEMAAALTPEERRRFLNVHGRLQRLLHEPGERRRPPPQ
jgi:uncharacterized membrane protein